MTEVYDLFMRIGLTGDILASLQQISSRLTQIAGQTDLLNAKFAEMGIALGKLGVAAIGLGAGTLLGLEKAAEYYDEIHEQQVRMLAAGFSQIDVQRALNVATGVALETHTKIQDANEMMLQLMRQFRSESIAEQIIKPVVEAQLALRRLGDETELAPIVRMWSREPDMTPEHMEERLRSLIRLVEHGVGAAEYQRIYAMMGAFGPAMGYDFRTKVLPELLYEMPAAGRSNLGMQLGQGFWQIMKDKKGEISALLAPGEQRPLNDPYEFSQALVRGMRARGEDVDMKNATKLLQDLGMSNREALPYLLMMLKGREVLGAATPFQETPGLESIPDLIKIKTIADAKAAAAAAINNLFIEIGRLGLTDVMLDRWKSLVAVLEGLTKWIRTLDPATVTGIAQTLVTISEILIGGGGIALTIAGLALMFSPAGAIGLAISGLIVLGAELYRTFDPELFRYKMSVITASFHDMINSLINLAHPNINWRTGAITFGGLPTDTAMQMIARRPFEGRTAPITLSGRPSTVGTWPIPGSTANPLPSGGFRVQPPSFGATPSGEPRSEGKPVTVVTNLNMDGRLLSQMLTHFVIEDMNQPTGAGASNWNTLSHNPDSLFSGSS